MWAQITACPCQCAPRSAGELPGGRASPRLLHRNELDEFDVGIRGEQLGAVLAEGCGDGAVEVGLPVLLGVKGVKDAEGVLADPEGVPGPGAGLGQHDVPAAVE